VTERSLADVVVDRKPTVLGVAMQRPPLIEGVENGLVQRALGQRPARQLGEIRQVVVRTPVPCRSHGARAARWSTSRKAILEVQVDN
jgi:hypothetical protein